MLLLSLTISRRNAYPAQTVASLVLLATLARNADLNTTTILRTTFAMRYVVTENVLA
jgi:hypothetical protein